MPDGIFCIDFGSAYTKVALRRGKRTNSEMVPNARHAADEFRICVPSAVVVDSSGPTPKYTFGLATEGRRSGGTIDVRQDWKRKLFDPEEAPGTPSRPVGFQPRTRMERFILSGELGKLAERYQVSAEELLNLRRLVVNATTLTMPLPSSPPAAPAPAAGSDTQRLAVEYFRWLRQVVFEACAGLSPALGNPKDLPVRVTMPAFAPENELARHPGAVRMGSALREAGWSLHNERPFTSEPYANAIGILTQGSNCTRARDMFRNGLLITALSSPKEHPVYRAVVVDVGSYTTDIAAFSLRTDGDRLLLSDVEFDTRTTSVRHGMSILDEAVLAALDEEHQSYMRTAPPGEWSKLRLKVYHNRGSFSTPVGEIGAGEELDRILQALDTFEQKLLEETHGFLKTLVDMDFKELILTGGGCTLPSIQRAIVGGAQKDRVPFRRVHLPSSKQTGTSLKTTPLQLVTPLEGTLPRGGTALGGTSAYFEMT